MFNKCSILVGLVMAVGVAASLIPPRATALQFHAPFNVTYIGNNLYTGQRQSGDWLLTQYSVYKPAVAKRIVTQTLSINSAYNLTFISAIDQSFNKTLGAFPRLVSGGPGSKNATLIFTSKIGQPIYHRVNSFGRR